MGQAYKGRLRAGAQVLDQGNRRKKKPGCTA